MKSTDPRDMTWSEIRDHLSGPREAVWDWLRAHGPATTTGIAEGMERHVVSVRPRVTELVQLGYAECAGRQGREGVYRALSPEEAMARHAEAARETQIPLKLS